MMNGWIYFLLAMITVSIASCNGSQDDGGSKHPDHEGKFRKIKLEVPDKIDIVYFDYHTTWKLKSVIIRTIDRPEEIAALIDEINTQPLYFSGNSTALLGQLNIIKDEEVVASIIVSSSGEYSIEKDGKFSPQQLHEGSLMHKIQQEMLTYREKIVKEFEKEEQDAEKEEGE